MARRAVAVLCAAAVAAAVLQACAPAAPRVGDTLTLQGRLVMKGNDPVFIPVLVTGKGQWELRGLDAKKALALQARPLTVTGTVLQATGAGPSLPKLEVQQVR